jgi:hypothetical protein
MPPIASLQFGLDMIVKCAWLAAIARIASPVAVVVNDTAIFK